MEAFGLVVGYLFIGGAGLWMLMLSIEKVFQFFDYFDLLRMNELRGDDLATQLRKLDAYECGHWRKTRKRVGADGLTYRQCYDCNKFIPESDDE